MNIALLLHRYFPYGGLQRDCLTMALQMRDLGHHVSIVCRTWSGEQPEGIHVVCLGKRGWTNLAMDKNYEQDVKQWLSVRDFDRVVTFSRVDVGADYYYAADPCYMERIKNTKPASYQRTRRYRYMSDLERSIFSSGSNTHILLLTEREVDDYQRIYATESKRLTILPPSIVRRDLSLERKHALRSSVRERMQWAEDQKIVVFVGSGFATKGLDRAIQAMSSTPPNTHLFVVGSGKPAKYKKLVLREGLSNRVHFLGARDDAWELMVGADLLIHPARSENTGTVIVEALSAGTPVLATDRCGYANHITLSNAGWVTPSPFNQNVINEKLNTALKVPWQALAEKALQYAMTEDLYSGMSAAASRVLEK